MQIQIAADEVFAEYKGQVAELHHELLLEKLKSRKLAELVEQYEQAEANRVQAAARQRGKAATTPPETLPEIPAPPAPPQASGELVGAKGDHT